MRANVVQLLHLGDEPRRRQHQDRSHNHAHPGGGDPRGVDLACANLSDEVAFVALAAARVKPKLGPPLGLFLELTAPGFEDLAKRRAWRSQRRVANYNRPIGGCV